MAAGLVQMLPPAMSVAGQTSTAASQKPPFPLRRHPDYRINDYAGHENNEALLDFIRGSQFQRAQKHRVTEAHEVAVCVDW